MLHASRRRDIEEAALGRAGGEVGVMRICNGSGVGGRVLLAEREGISTNVMIRNQDTHIIIQSEHYLRSIEALSSWIDAKI